MNDKTKGLILAYEKGYKITEEGVLYNPNEKIIKGGINTNGYKCFSVKIENNKVVKVTFHRFQAYFKFGDKLFKENIEVRHLNGEKLDNSWKNIEIGTHSENMNDIPKAKRLAKSIHASSFLKKYNYDDIINYYNIIKSYNLVMKHFNITSKGTLFWILKSKYK